MAESDANSQVPFTVCEVYRDDELIAVSKPSGLLVHRSKISTDTDALLQRVRDHVGQYVYPVHRIDRGASGIVLFTLDSRSVHWVQRAMNDYESRKEYLVLVRGSPPDEWFSIRPLRSEEGSPQAAHSEFVTLERFSKCALVRARIHTGRQHQIRRHLNHGAHHVIGDTTYGKGRLNVEFRKRYGLHRLFLHSERLVIFHAKKREWITIEAPLTAELVGVLEALRAEKKAETSP